VSGEVWIKDLLGYKDLSENGGSTYPRRNAIDFTGDVVITDDPVNDKTIIDITATPIGSSVVEYKSTCRVATIANIALSGLLTIDGVSLADGDRVLVKAQGTASENGIYVAATIGWTRAADFDADAEIKAGCLIPVAEGSVNADSLFQLTTDNPITLGVSALAFAEIGSTDAASLRGKNLDAATIGTPGTDAVIAYDGASYIAQKILNANIDAAAAIGVSKLAVGTNGQFLRTTAGIATWATLTPGDLGDNVITPSAITASTHNYAPAGWSDATIVRLSSTTTLGISGFDATALLKRKLLINVGTFPIFIQHDNVGSSASNRTFTPNGLGQWIAPGGSVAISYDATSARWRLLEQINVDQASFGTAVAATENNFAPTGWGYADVFRLVPSGNAVITGFDGTQTYQNSRIIRHLINESAFTITLKHNDAGSSAGNKLFCPGSADMVLQPAEAVAIAYTNGIWKVLASNSKQVPSTWQGVQTFATSPLLSGSAEIDYSPARQRFTMIAMERARPLYLGLPDTAVWTFTVASDSWSTLQSNASKELRPRLLWAVDLPKGAFLQAVQCVVNNTAAPANSSVPTVRVVEVTPDVTPAYSTSTLAVVGEQSGTSTSGAQLIQLNDSSSPNALGTSEAEMDPANKRYRIEIIANELTSTEAFEVWWVQIRWSDVGLRSNRQ